MMASISIEDFLKNVFALVNLGQKANTSKLARRLNVSNAAITDMSRKLSQRNLINYEKYRDITLTPEGEEIALSVVRRHRLWEVFLNEVLHIPWEKVHDEAERLEHHTSEYLINELDKFLNFPRIDPHGDPIPDKNGHLAKQEFVCLRDVQASTIVSLKRIVEHTGEIMDFLNEINCSLGQEIRVGELNVHQKTIQLSISGKEIMMPLFVAEKLYVE